MTSSAILSTPHHSGIMLPVKTISTKRYQSCYPSQQQQINHHHQQQQHHHQHQINHQQQQQQVQQQLQQVNHHHQQQLVKQEQLNSQQQDQYQSAFSVPRLSSSVKSDIQKHEIASNISGLGDFLTTLQQASSPVLDPTSNGQSKQTSQQHISNNENQSATSVNPAANMNKGTPLYIQGGSVLSYFSLLQAKSQPLVLNPLASEANYNQQANQARYQPYFYQSPHISSTSGEAFQPKQLLDHSVNNILHHEPALQSPGFSGLNSATYNTNGSIQETKVEPVTPVGKGQKSLGYDNSPAMESRFSESLYTLLGSPPPDSPLSKNPFFGDLQNLLTNECKKDIFPQSLFGMKPKKENELKEKNVFDRERKLQERFTGLQEMHPEEIRQLSSVFRYQSALIETERFRTLHECQYPGSYKETVNSFYDDKLQKVMDRVERSIVLLEKAEKENKPRDKLSKPRPHLSKAGVRLLEQWYSENVEHPYPDNTTIELLAQAGNIGVEQVKKWFANKRNRSQNTRSLTEIAIQKRRLGQVAGKSGV